MAFNFENAENSAFENYALYAPIGNATAIVNNTNYLNPLTSGVLKSNTNLPRIFRRQEKTPEPPPAPNLSRNMKPNQGGGAPMDIEIDDCEIITRTEVETTAAAAIKTTTANLNSLAKTLTETEKLNSSTTTATTPMTDSNLFLNGFSTGGYMFFPAATSTAAAASAATATMLMDPTTTAMMAAAMQQIQQTYPNYGLTATDGNGGDGTSAAVAAGGTLKEIIKTKHCILFPPNPDAPPPTIRERPPGCRTVFVGGLPENITEEIIREIFESCGEITTLRMSKKNFCHIRYRTEASIDHAIYLSGYRLRIADASDPMNYGRLHVDYAQARDDQYDFECRQRQQLREQRHRERIAMDRSESPPPIPHYTDHEASLVSEHLRNNDTFLKSVQTITVWLERGDCTKRNANAFYSMIQSTHAHVRRLYADKQLLEQDLRKARESYRKQMLTMSTQFTQIEKVFSAASHKKVWDHFTKAQRKNIDQWKKLASELRSVQIEDDEMEMSDDDRDSRCSSTKKARHDSDTLKEENDSLRCQIDAMRNEMFLNRSELKQDSDFREKQIKVLQETIRNMQTQFLQTKVREQKDAKLMEQLERELKEARVRALLLQTQIKETRNKQKETKILGAASTATSALNEEDSARASNDEEDGSRQSPNQQSLQQQQQTETEINHIVEESEIAKCQETKVDDENKENREIIVDCLQNVEISDIELDNVVVSDNIDAVGVDKDDDVHFVDVKRKDIESRNGLVNLKTAEIALNDNIVVSLIEEEENALVEVVDNNSNEVAPSNKSSNNFDQEKIVEAAELTSDRCKEPAVDDSSVHKTEEEMICVDNSKPNAECKSLLHFEARIITLAAAYLVVQPLGALSSSICLYLSNFIKANKITVKPLEVILKKYGNLFMPMENDDHTNCVYNTDGEEKKDQNEKELKWKFCGFMENEESSS